MLYADPYYERSEVSNSDLSRIKKEKMGDDRPEPLEAYRFGNLIDYMITEPHLIDYTNQTCAGEWFDDETWNTALEMKKAFFRDPMCAQIAAAAEGQKVSTRRAQPFKYKCWEFTLNTRCKWDFWMPSLGWGADLKSTVATSQKQFEDACRHFDYDRSRAWYMDIEQSNQDMLIGVSKKNFQVFKVPIKRGDDWYNTGKRKIGWLALEAWKYGLGN